MEHAGKDISCGKLRELFAALAQHGGNVLGRILREEVGLDAQSLAAGGGGAGNVERGRA